MSGQTNTSKSGYQLEKKCCKRKRIRSEERWSFHKLAFYCHDRGDNDFAADIRRPQSLPEDHSQLVHDDDEVNSKFKDGYFLFKRYKILSTLGEGSFGRVFEVKDMEKNRNLAIKVAKHSNIYWDVSKFEINVLEKIAKYDPTNKHLCIKLMGHFKQHGHMCIVLEKLGSSILEFLKENHFEPFPMEQIRHIAYQLCYSVNFLHSNMLTHTDLKPENILFVNSEYVTDYDLKNQKEYRRLLCADIRLIDFGSATFDYDEHNSVVTTRPFRAPEVILQLGWSHPCDVWSIGCILFQLYTGELLFENVDDIEHLAMMEYILGKFPIQLISKSKCSYFENDLLHWEKDSSFGICMRQTHNPILHYIKVNNDDHFDLFDLIQRMLMYDQNHRITLHEALQHAFFKTCHPKF